MKRKLGAGWLCLAGAMAATGIAPAQTFVYHVIRSFGDYPHGANPYATLTADSSGNLYGTTVKGGTSDLGAVFKLSKSGFQVLYSFEGGSDGCNPYAGVTLDAEGNLYGTTFNCGPSNQGTVYKLSPSGQETVLYSFTGGTDGGEPYAGVILDSAGNLYGTTYYGGLTDGGEFRGNGVVYKLTPSGQETVLHTFGSQSPDGANPYSGVIADATGNLYGTTYNGGQDTCGTVYELSPSNQFTVLYSFQGASDTCNPYAGVIRDAAGNFYGTANRTVYELTANGVYHELAFLPPANTGGMAVAGVTRDAAGNLYGTTTGRGMETHAPDGVVYKLDTAGNLTVLYTFTGGADGAIPEGGVLVDPAGNIFGTTSSGGAGGVGTVYQVSPGGQETTLYGFLGAAGGTAPSSLMLGAGGNLYGTAGGGGATNNGVVFKLSSSGEYSVLYSFNGGTDGSGPIGDLALDSAGNIYGATVYGGPSNNGVVYKVSPSGQESLLYNFTGGVDGGLPEGGVALDPAGNLFGTTFAGGSANQGVVFKIDGSGQETVMYSFTGATDGAVPAAGVIMDPSGRLYGTTYSGGLAGGGVVYRIDGVGQETVLHNFGVGGSGPEAAVIRDPDGNLYGTTAFGGVGGEGVVYELDAAGSYTVLYNFTEGPDGAGPLAGLVRDSAGNLYGTTAGGGTPGGSEVDGWGVVFKLSPSGQETVLHSFTGGADGGEPFARVILNPDGRLCGTTSQGGAGSGGVLYCLALR